MNKPSLQISSPVATAFRNKRFDPSLRDRLFHLLAEGPSVRSVQVGHGFAIGTVKGPARRDNQDRAVVAQIASARSPRPLTVAVICDGMGGMEEGGKAAALAASTFIAVLASSSGELSERALSAIQSANGAVYNRYRGKGGTTLTALLLGGERTAIVVHAGDSRLYERTLADLRLMTVDDTVQGMVRAGSLEGGDEDELDNHLIQFVGIGDDLEAHVFALPRRPEDRGGTGWLVTSDGAHGLGKRLLQGISQNALSIGDLMRKLMYVADAAGVSDNATAIAVFSQEVSASPLFHTGTTLSVWTPTKSLELWVSDQAEAARAPNSAAAAGTVGEAEAVKPKRLKLKPPSRQPKKRSAAGEKLSSRGPEPVETEERREGQLNISFGENTDKK